jgi:hypothetical protein
MQTRAVTKRQPDIPGVIDTISDGLTIALAYPLLMTLPVLLDVYFWLGWRLTPEPLLAPIRRWIDDNNGQDAESTLDALESLGRSDMTTLTAQFVPALLPGVDRGDVYELWSRPAIELRHWWIVCLVLIAMVVLAAGLFAAYSVPMTDIAIGRSRPVRQVLGAVLRVWLRFLGVLVLILGLFLLVLGPLGVLWGVSEVIGIGLGALILPIMILAGLTMMVFLFFAPEAIVVAEVGPFRAMYYSVNVVRRNFGQTLGFIAASMIISFGLGEIWQRLADTPPGLMTAVIANAFFAGGLAVAGIIFFNNRLRQLPRAQQIGRATGASNQGA